MADQQQPKQINFTIVPDDTSSAPRTYANFCSIAHTPFDFTLTFCEVMPLSDKEIKEAETDHVVRAPVRTKIVVPVQFVPNLIAALQEHWRVAFRRRYFTSRTALQRSLAAFMQSYNHERPHQGYRVRGRTPAALFWGAARA